MGKKRAEADEGRSIQRHLLKDAGFWWVLLAGTLGCWMVGRLILASDGSVNLAAQWQQLAWLVLLYPTFEEWVFRGVLQPGLLKRGHGSRAWLGITEANGWTTMAFALLHLLTHPPLWAALVVVPSLLFGWFRDRYNSIIPGLILHSTYNLAYFITFGLPGQA